MYLPHNIMMFPILCYILLCHLQNIGLQKRHSTYTSDYQLTNPTNGWTSLVQENKNMVGKSLTVSSQSVTLNILWISSTTLPGSTILMSSSVANIQSWKWALRYSPICIFKILKLFQWLNPSQTFISNDDCTLYWYWIWWKFPIETFSSTSDGMVTGAPFQVVVVYLILDICGYRI